MSEINDIIDFVWYGDARKKLENSLRHELYPAAFSDVYSWMRVRNSLDAYDEFLKACLTDILTKLQK